MIKGDDKTKLRDSVVGFMVMWVGFVLGGWIYLSFDFWGKQGVVMIIVGIAGFFGWVAGVATLAWCEENLPKRWAGWVGWSVLLLNFFLVHGFAIRFGLDEW